MGGRGYGGRKKMQREEVGMRGLSGSEQFTQFMENLWAQNDLIQISPSLPSCAYQLTFCILISSLVSGMQTPEISKFLCAKALTYVINTSPPPESNSHWPQGTLLQGELLIGPQQDIGGRRCHHTVSRPISGCWPRGKPETAEAGLCPRGQ